MKLKLFYLQVFSFCLVGSLLLCLPSPAVADANVEPSPTVTNTPVNTPTDTPIPTSTNLPQPTSTASVAPLPSQTPAYPYPDSISAGAELDFTEPAQPWTAQLGVLDWILMILILLVLAAFGGLALYWVYFFKPTQDEDPPVYPPGLT